ncbi:MAG: dihydrolipoamide acetyltransferase family protein [Chloroflexota bacterium]
MSTEIFMPALGMNQETGKIIEWLAQEGQNVVKGQPMMVVETDKATVELEAPASGKLINVTARDGDEVPVGKVIALVVNEGEAVPTVPAFESPLPSAVAVQTPDSVPPGAAANVKLASPLAARIAEEHRLDLSQVPCEGKRIQKEDVLAYLAQQGTASQTQADRKLASPKARRLAREHNIDLHSLPGSGPGGALLAEDIIKAVEAQTNQPGAGMASTGVSLPVTQTPVAAPTEIPVSHMWQVMARRMTESWQTIPHFYLEAEANATRLQAWRTRLLDRFEEKVSLTDLLVKLVAVALRRHPRINASWVNGTIQSNPEINIGLAVAVDGGLMVPVIRNADQLGIQALGAKRKVLVTGAQAGRLPLADLCGGTFTISNLGKFPCIDNFTAIINPPEAAILGLGRITDKVLAVNGHAVVQPVLRMTLTCDHRVIDGARGAEFLQTLTNLIDEPLAVLD